MGFLTTLSPKGGKRLASILVSLKGDTNMIFHPEKRPVEVNDYWTLELGYAECDIKKGEKIRIKKSDGKYMKGFFERFF